MVLTLFDELLGKSFCNIGRAANMIWVSFGNERVKNSKGEDRPVYGLHCQCACRIIRCGKVFAASSDVYTPPSGVPWSEDFFWDKKDGNLFDEKAHFINTELHNVPVTGVDVTDLCDLRITFKNGAVFEAFSDSSTEENWRILKRSEDGNSEHIVAIGSELVKE